MKFFVRDGKGSTKQKVLFAVFAIIPLVAQPMYSLVASQVANAAGEATVVTPVSMQGWEKYGTGQLAFQNVADAPLGQGALKISTPDGSQYVGLDREITPTSAHTFNFSYDTKRLGDVAHAAPAYVLAIDKDGDLSTDDYFWAWYEPVYNNPGGKDYSAWNTWTLTPSAKYWYNGAKPAEAVSYTQTLSSVLINLPNAKIVGATINMGTGNDGWSALVDNVKTSDATYDLEPATIAACAATTNVHSTTLASWSTSDTKSAGSNQIIADGLHVVTTPSAGGNAESKAAGYYATNFPLSEVGVPAIEMTSHSGGKPSLQLTVDNNGNGVWYGNLVYEPWAYGEGKFWSSKDFGISSGMGYTSFGTLEDFLNARPNTKVIAVGYSLGSGVVGDATITKLTAGCVDYTFGLPAPEVPINLNLKETVSGNTINNLGYTNKDKVTASWGMPVGETADSYEYVYWNDVATSPYTAASPWVMPTNATSYAGTVNQGEGVHHWAVRSVKNGMKSDLSNLYTFTYDITRPQVELLSPVAINPTSYAVKGTDNFALKTVTAHLYDKTNTALIKNCSATATPAETNEYTLNCSVPALADGEYTIRYNSLDMAGNISETKTSKFIVDHTAPTISINNAFGGDVASKIFREVSFGYYDANKVAYAQFNNDKIHNFTDAVWSNTDTVWANRSWTGVHEGLNSVDLYDVAGNKATMQFTIDRTAPEVGLTAPTGTTNANSVEVKGWATDANMRYYACYITTNQPIYAFGTNWSTGQEPKDGSDNDQSLADSACVTTWTSVNVGDSSNPVALGNFDIAGLPDGTYTIHMHAHDLAGNQNEATTEFTIDRTAPTISSIIYNASPSGTQVFTDGYTNEKNFVFHLVSGDGTTRYQLKYWNYIAGSGFNGESHAWSPADISATGHMATLGEYTDNFTQGEGTHYFAFSACDAAGNCSEYSAPFVVTYDNTAPVVSVNAVVSSTNTAPAISGTTSEKGKKVKIKIDDGEWIEVDSYAEGNWSYTPTTALTVGTHKVVVVATDAAGNTSSSDTSVPQSYWTQFAVIAPTVTNTDNRTSSNTDRDDIDRGPVAAAATTNPNITNPNDGDGDNTVTNDNATTDNSEDTDVLAESTTNESDNEGQVLAAQDEKGNWSVVNLVLAVVTIILSLGALLGLARKKDGTAARTMTLIPVAIAVTAFLMIENWTASMIWLNWWTVLYAVVLAVQVAIVSGLKNSAE